MDITIDLIPIIEFFNLPPNEMLLRFLLLFGWIPIGLTLLWGMKEIWMTYIRAKWLAEQKFILLAIDIPRGNVQSPKAVENIFTYLAGAQGSHTLIEKYWDGEFQLSFSLEIVSIDGYTQFLIYTPGVYRDLVESAVYSQYPDAEITEVGDYTENAPRRFPDDEYDLWGAEFVLAKSAAYPIKCYEEFQHQYGEPEVQFKDPMATLMDLYSSVRPGEQLWYQIIITPINFDWTSIGDAEISKILGEGTGSGDNIADKLTKMFTDFLWWFSEQIYRFGVESEEKKQDDTMMKMMNLKPKEKKQIEMINRKAAKVAFEFRMRFVYLARQDVVNKAKAVNGFVGYIKQFADLDLNNLKPEMKLTGTSANYFFTKPRLNKKKTRIINNYVRRYTEEKLKPGILNIEELATVWHFPIEAVVRAPLVQKAPGRKAEAPMSLPFGGEEEFPAGPQSEKEDIFGEPPAEAGKKPAPRREKAGPEKEEEREGDIFSKEELDRTVVKKGSPPENLPFG